MAYFQSIYGITDQVGSVVILVAIHIHYIYKYIIIMNGHWHYNHWDTDTYKQFSWKVKVIMTCKLQQT